MSCIESVLRFESAGASLLGILAQPADPSAAVSSAMIIIVGGPQYRVGSHRQFTLLARRLAGEGIAVLRFDYAGMGDSEGPKREFTEVSGDVKAAVDALHARLPQLQGVTLWGLCDGASAALLYVDETADARVKGLCLFNPWVRSAQSLAKAQVKHYYIERLRQADFWRKLLSGKVAASALSELAGKVLASFGSGKPAGGASLSFQGRMARAWQAFPGQILLVLSGQDLVAKEFIEQTGAGGAWTQLWQRRQLRLEHLPDADHTCSTDSARKLAEQLTLDWHRDLVASPR